MKYRNTITATAAALLMVGCGEENVKTIAFDSLSVDKEVKLSNDERSPMCAVHLQLCYATEENGHKAEVVNNAIEERLLDMTDLKMAHAADSFASHYTTSYVKNFLPLYNQDRADTTKRSWYEYHYIITSNTHQGKNGTAVYVANIDYYEGGAHGISQQLTMNFNGQTGQLLTVNDVFVPGHEAKLNEILEKALREKAGAKDLKELKDMGYLYMMDMFAPQNFLLDEETITFIYNPYEIAPYAMGNTELTIALSALKDILKEEYRP